ncbi:ABC transporter ATP-binding protein [Rhodococcus sp. HNM0569]|uniref:ABC transporter ATP-binding protein n=1 Tax=Rhodococcus sp. HNM0569 TaxID=2716340 RepID=UPI00146C04D7|nr:ABC transporter ATP-binding protein [Rhodococcus sp. HNM0569]NLU82547.1 ABC transporter ATP-binding protein [Rhodococcus sp. HNM0569]
MIRTLSALLPEEHRAKVWGYLVLTIVSTLLRAVAVVLVVPLVSALFTDEPSDAWPWVAALTGGVVVGWIVDSVASRVGFDLGFAILDRAQHEVSTQVARIPLRWFTADNTATARRAIATTGPDLVGLVGYLVTPLIQAVLLPVAIGVALLPIAWQLGVVALVAVPLVLGALWATERLTCRADELAAESNSALTERILEFVRTQAALRAARRAEPARGQVGAALDAQRGATLRLLALQIPGEVLFSLASQVALLLLASTTTWLAVRGTLGIPESIALIVVVVRYLEPFASLGDLAAATTSTRSSVRDIRTVLDAADPAGGTRAPATDEAPTVELREVTFRYDSSVADSSDTPIFDGLDVVFEAGRTTAVVGPSGSGKSTLLALVAGLEEPTGGSVVVGGIDRRTLDRAERTADTSVVFQQPYLFAGTIRENVLAGNPDADADELASALRLSRVEQFASRLPEDTATLVGEAGTALSGGERQRVSIARALVKPSSLLLVDEGTSALDAENEAAVADAITADPRRRTRIVVTHRLSTIAGADRVLFLEGGRIVEDGSVDELLAAGGRFADFWRHQHDAAGWRFTASAD